MNYENKYNDALEKLQEALAPKDGREISGLTRGCIEEIFPELKESEDEKMRKSVIYALRNGGFYDNDKTDEAIAWLEKQGKQKTDIPKWKYKKDNAPLSKDCLILNRYGCVVKSVSGAMVSDAWVLDYNELVKLPKEEVEKQGEKLQGKTALEAIKEEKVDNSNKVETNSAWSEEDETILDNLIYALANDRIGNNRDEYVDWLKSIKERVQPQNLWKPSEEQIQCLYDAIEHYHTNGYPASKLNELYEQMSKIYKL